jgi:hypothetical protein
MPIEILVLEMETGSKERRGQRIADGMEHGAGRFVADADRREGNSRLHAAFDQVAHQTEQPKPEMPRREVAHQEQTNIYGGPTNG